MLMQGASTAQHRFEVRMKADDRSVFKGHGSMDIADEYARHYTGRKFKFSEDDRAPERDRGRDMGKPTVLYRVMPNGERIAWREYSLKGDEVVAKDTKAYQDERAAQKLRNIAAVERARAAAAESYQAEIDKSRQQADAMGSAFGKKMRELLKEIADLKDSAGNSEASKPNAAKAESETEPAGKAEK